MHVDVGAEPHVVGEIPSLVIGVVIDDDLIAIPIPVITVGQIKRGNPEVEAVKPKAVGPASGKVPHMVRAEAAGEASMFERMIQVEASIIVPVIMADPFAVVMDVRGFGVAWFVMADRPGWRAMGNRRTVFWNVSATDGMAAGFMVVVLRHGGKRKEHRYGNNCEE